MRRDHRWIHQNAGREPLSRPDCITCHSLTQSSELSSSLCPGIPQPRWVGRAAVLTIISWLVSATLSLSLAVGLSGNGESIRGVPILMELQIRIMDCRHGGAGFFFFLRCDYLLMF